MIPRLGFLDRYLTLWIFLAMAAGLMIGYLVPDVSGWIHAFSVGSTNLPLAVGLIVMMYPPLAKVQYELVPRAFEDRKVLGLSLVLNWLVGPVLMFVLAVIFLPDAPEYRSGLILIGLARCIAMVIVWNDLAGGSREYGALLVALNSIFQMVAYSFYAWLFMQVLPEQLGLPPMQVDVPVWEVVQSVLLYLGVPFLSGYLSRRVLLKTRGRDWYASVFLPRISPFTLYALLFTIVLMFSLKGDQIIQLPWDVARVAMPLIAYFLLMFFSSFMIGRRMGIPYDRNASIAFTATGNNFELAIAVSIAVFGLHKPQAFVGVIGPLIEVPVLILLVKASQKLKQIYYPS